MRIACVGYRKWALNIYDSLANSLDHNFFIIRSKEQFSAEAIVDFNPDLILFYGWSWIVDIKIINKFNCLMLHPSPLPKYRGGSPIQNQIIRGEKKSMVSIFKMNNELDSGDILIQSPLSLEGDLSMIFDKIEKIGIQITKEILLNNPKPTPQDHDSATSFRRLKPEHSEITLNELTNKNAEYLFNKIRMLADPYPNAYIKTKDNKFLILKKVELKDKLFE